jgi:chemotaxis protein histidine kinase CheA
LGEFLTETGEDLDQLDAELVRFEQNPNNAEMLNTIFRLVHTLKGTCGFLGLARLAKLEHAAETLMANIATASRLRLTASASSSMSIDRIKQDPRRARAGWRRASGLGCRFDRKPAGSRPARSYAGHPRNFGGARTSMAGTGPAMTIF